MRRCADDTFLAYAPACECGWRGDDHPPTPEGHAAAQRQWLDSHFQDIAGQDQAWHPADFLYPLA